MRKIFIHFQPIFDLRTGIPKQIECLARIQSDTGDLVYPCDFLPCISKAGTFLDFDLHVLDAIAETAQPVLQQYPDVELCVNLSPMTLASKDFPAVLARTLSKNGLPASRLVLHINTHELATEPDTLAPVLARLNRLGVKTAIEDFGRACSALLLLHELPVQVINLDGSLLHPPHGTAEHRQFLAALCNVITTAGKTIVAKRVESSDLIPTLAPHGALGQGNHLSPPLTIHELLGLLHDLGTNPLGANKFLSRPLAPPGTD